MMKIRDFIPRGAAGCDNRGFKQVQRRIHVLSHFSNKSTSGQALRSPIRFVARSSADEWDNIIHYDRNRQSWKSVKPPAQCQMPRSGRLSELRRDPNFCSPILVHFCFNQQRDIHAMEIHQIQK